MKNREVLILGNGKSRLIEWSFITSWKGEIWACNYAYTEIKYFPRLDRIASAHDDILIQAAKFRDQNGYQFTTNKNYRLFSVRKIEGIESELFKCTIGWSTGSLSLYQALYEGYSKIVLSGFDMGGPDIYNPQNSGSNFRKQYNRILKEFNPEELYFLYRGKLIKAKSELPETEEYHGEHYS